MKKTFFGVIKMTLWLVHDYTCQLFLIYGREIFILRMLAFFVGVR